MSELRNRITVDPTICHGKPAIRGLRDPVESILELLKSGMSPEEIVADYEDLEPEDIRAVIEYASQPINSNGKTFFVSPLRPR